MKRSTFSLCFFIRRTKRLQNGEAAIYLRITVNNRRVEAAVNKSVDPEIWDNSRGLTKGRTKEGKSINLFLDGIRNQVFEARLTLAEKKKKITATALRDITLGREPEEVTLIGYYEKHNLRLSELVGSEVTNATWIRHKTSINNVRTFLKVKYGKPDIPIEEVTNTFLRDYQHYLRVDRTCCNNSAIKYVKNLGKVLREAMAEGLIERSPFLGIRHKLDQVDPVYLTETELLRIRLQMFDDPALDKVRDVFVFCCYTGLSYIDVKELQPDDFRSDPEGQLWIVKKRGKTRVESTIPLLEVPEKILLKYYQSLEMEILDQMLPVLSNQKYNDHLKEVARICKINKNLTSHAARHTFATTVTLQKGISLEVVSKMLGHSSTKMTQHYARILEERIGNEMKRLR